MRFKIDFLVCVYLQIQFTARGRFEPEKTKIYRPKLIQTKKKIKDKLLYCSLKFTHNTHTSTSKKK